MTLPPPPAPASAALRRAARAADEHLHNCRLCPHRCGEARRSAEGHCRVGQQAHIASEMLHMGEEMLLRPAHAIFFSGCTATCRFCTAARFAFHPTRGVVVTPGQLARRIEERQRQGASAICFIGGDPVPHIPFVLQTLATLGDARRVPAVFNSNYYVSPEALALLEPAIDIHLPDFKFGPDPACGEILGGMPEYWSTVTAALDRLRRGQRRVIVRHLLMPGHFACCTEPVLSWLAERKDLSLSLLTQYLPPAHAGGALAQPLPAADVARARDLVARLGIATVQ